MLKRILILYIGYATLLATRCKPAKSPFSALILLSTAPLVFYTKTTYAALDWGLGLNSRWAIDISSKASWDPDTHHSAMAHAFGLDFHKVFSSESGDIGTLVFQPYLVSLNNVPNPPFFFDDGNDTELTWRIANFNYTALSEGEFNIRAGHFEIPFGLEQNIDTNGALRQYTFSDRGIKADWGISVNGVLPALDYEIALTRGSGNEIENQENPYIISGRIGSPSYKNLVSGFSWLYGDVLGAVGVTRLKRAAVDVAYYYHNWEFLMELSGGKNEHTDTLNSLIEVSWRNALEDLHLYIQWRHLQLKPESRWEAGDDIAAGVRWLPMPYLEISTQYEKQVDLIKQQQNPTRLTLQFRLRI